MITYTIFTFFKQATSITKRLFLLALFITLMASALFAQQNNLAQSQYAKAKIDISHLARLEDKASEVVDVTIDRRTLRLALKYFSNSKDPDEIKIRDLVAGIEGIYVKVINSKMKRNTLFQISRPFIHSSKLPVGFASPEFAARKKMRRMLKFR